MVLIVCSGGSRGGGRGGRPLIFRPNQEPMTKLRREGLKKKKLDIGQPPYLRVWIAAPPPPLLLPYLKIRIRHWFVPLERSLSSLE